MISTCSHSTPMPTMINRVIGKIKGKVSGPSVVFLQEFMAMNQQVFMHWKTYSGN